MSEMGAIRLANRFSVLVKHYRDAADISQEKLAELMKVSVGTVRNWEQVGVTKLPPQRIRALAGFINAPAHELAAAMGYPIEGGPDKRTLQPEEIGLPPLKGEDLDKVIEYAWLLYEKKREKSQPSTERRAGGDPNAA